MSDFAPNWTPRYRVRYSTRGGTHTMQFRIARAADPGDFSGMAGKVGSFLEALESLLFTDWTVLSATGALQDSDIFLPAPVPTGFTPAASTTGESLATKAWETGFIGRSSNGGRGAFFIYGLRQNPITVTPPQDFRIFTSENSVFEDAVTALDELSPAFAANDGFAVNWYQYVNVKYNDYWVRRLRQGG